MKRIKIRLDSGFMFREAEIIRILAVWAQGKSVLLVGIRRTGKTQVMKASLLRQEGIGPVEYLEVQTTTTLYDFYSQLIAILPKDLLQSAVDLLNSAKTVPDTVMQWVRTHVGHVEIPGGGGIDLKAPVNLPQYWEPLLRALEIAVQERSPTAMPVIGIDELPFMLENLKATNTPINDIRIMLAGLRKLRDAGLRMILGGSISMENWLTLHGIPHTVLGGIWRESIPAFTREEAQSYLDVQLKNLPAQVHIQTILNSLPDFVPEFLFIAVTALKDIDQVSVIETSIDNVVLPAIRRSFLEQFSERLGNHYQANDAKCAAAILDQIAALPPEGGALNSTQLPEGWHRVLTSLKYDMFITEAPHLGYRFTLNLIRLWWRSIRNMP
jgi:hypothetical protein